MAENEFSILELLHELFTTAWEKACALVAAAAIFLPVWHPTLKEASDQAALVAPILGCAWLIVQIIAKTLEIARLKRSSLDDDAE